MFPRMIGEMKECRDRFRCVFAVFLYVQMLFSESVAWPSPRFADVYLFAKTVSYAVNDIGWGTGEMISDLDGSLGSRHFLTLRMKGHVLQRAHAHLKVPGWSLIWNALLTKKLPTFFSRLNEINGAGGTFEEIYSFPSVTFEFWPWINMLGAMMACLNNRSTIATFKWRMIIAVIASQLIFQFKQLERRSLKKIRASTGFELVTSDTGAMLYQLSYEATHWERGQFIATFVEKIAHFL